MSKKKNILVINSREYDALTGLPLDGKTLKPKSGTEPKPHIDKKPIAILAKQPKAKTANNKTKTAHKPAMNVSAHKPKPAATLNRLGVKKPPKSLKRTIKTQGHVESIAKFPASTIRVKKSAKKIDNKLLLYAKRIHRSPLIKHFSSVAASDLNLTGSTSTSTDAAKPKAPPKLSNTATAYVKTQKPKTTEELLEYAISQATSHEQKPPPKKSRNPLKRKS